MTKIYKAGEHVRIIESDASYDDDLGNQTGLVGKVMEVNSSGHVYVKFPHVDERFYYLNREVEPATNKPTPAPEPVKEEPVFKAGEYVKITSGTYGSDYMHTPLKVRDTVVKGDIYAAVDMVPEQGGDPWAGTIPVSVLEKTEAPEPEKVYLFRKGDHVRFLAGYNEDWTGAEFTVREDVETKGYYTLAPLTVTKPARSGYAVGSDTQVGGHRLEKFTPAPEPKFKFKLGDWVQVQGYSAPGSVWEDFVGEVTHLPYYSAGRAYIIDNHTGGDFSTGGFQEKYLVAAEKPVSTFKVGDRVEFLENYSNHADKGDAGTVTHVSSSGSMETVTVALDDNRRGYDPISFARRLKLTDKAKPYTPKFKIGDWVKVTGWSSLFDGNVYQVKGLPEHTGGCYVLKNENGTDGFSDTYLEAAEEPHWTVAKPVGTATRIGARTLVKVEEDKWLFVYDTDSNYPSLTYRNNAETKNLFKLDAPTTFVTAI